MSERCEKCGSWHGEVHTMPNGNRIHINCGGRLEQQDDDVETDE